MINLMKSELLKIKKSLPIKIMFMLMLCFSIVTSILSYSFVNSGKTEEFGMTVKGYNSFFSSIEDIATNLIVGIIMVGILICSDFDNRTIQSEIATGHSRFKILLSKIFSITIANYIIFLPYPVGRAVLQGIFIGFGKTISIDIIINMILAYTTVILIGVALNSISILISFMIQRTVMVLGISVVTVLLGVNFLLALGEANEGLGNILSYTPIGISRRLIAEGYGNNIMVISIITSLIAIALFSIITYIIFRKKELK